MVSKNGLVHFRVLDVQDDLTGLYVTELRRSEWERLSPQKRDAHVRARIAEHLQSAEFVRIVWVEEELPREGM